MEGLIKMTFYVNNEVCIDKLFVIINKIYRGVLYELYEINQNKKIYKGL